MMQKSKDPEVIALSDEEVEALKRRVSESSLALPDQNILLNVLSLYFWIQSQLLRAKLSIVRLKKSFGFSTEKKKSLNGETKGNEPNPDLSAPALTADIEEKNPKQNTAVDTAVKKPPRKINPDANHGRTANCAYTGCPLIPISHENLTAGAACPSCQACLSNGRLIQEPARIVVQLKGSPLITGVRYEVERLRCSLCKEYFEAPLPKEAATRGKYDASCGTSLAIARYYAGQPFYRTEQLQASQGVPLADATQWDLVHKLYPLVSPVHTALINLAANGSLIFYDDTGSRILAAYSVGKGKAVHTTSFISQYGEYPIYLFFTGLPIAGDNLEGLLEKRTSEEQLMTMSDASANNIPDTLPEDLIARWILCFCLVHGRRKFYELQRFYGKECEFVLDIISQVYQHEAYCKKEHYSAQLRLEYHQTHSKPLMDALRIWLNNLLLHQLIEPNSALGQSTRYLLRHFDALTRFLHVQGAPIDNSLCEQAIKIAIRHRRNSLFYKTFKSAQVGDCFMSLIHTAAKNQVNIFNYLNTLQHYAKEVAEDPLQWLPWNYQATLTNLSNTISKAA